jgi:hypothetical protein
MFRCYGCCTDVDVCYLVTTVPFDDMWFGRIDEWSMMTSLCAQGGIFCNAVVPFMNFECLHLHSEASQGLLNLLIHL